MVKVQKRIEIHSYALKAGSSKGPSYEIALGSGEENSFKNCKKKKTLNNILCYFMKSKPHQNQFGRTNFITETKSQRAHF